MRRELHVRIWEGGGVRFPSATRLILPLPKRRRGAGVMECPGSPVCGLQAGSTSTEDEARLLQGHEPAWGLSEPII